MKEYTLAELEEWREAYFEGGLDLPEELIEFLFHVAIERSDVE